MAQNIIRVNSINDRYVTEAMIGLNLNLNEEIDFDFFDDIQKPGGEVLCKEQASIISAESRPHSPDSEEEDDDDDVQVSSQLSSQNSGEDDTTPYQETGATKIKGVLSSDSVEKVFSTKREHEENLTNISDRYHSDENSENTDNSGDMHDADIQASLSTTSEIHETIPLHTQFPHDNTKRERATGNLESEDDLVGDSIELSSLKKSYATASAPKNALQEFVNVGEIFVDPQHAEDLDSLINPVQPNDFSTKECDETDSLPLEDGALSCTSDKSHESASGDSNSDSDEGCPFEESDSEELLLAVHTLMIIPRDRDRTSSDHGEKISELLDDAQKTGTQYATSCEKANITARSSSGYSSASCKTHGITASKKAAKSKANVRPSPVKISTPDMEEFIKSFSSLRPTSPVVSFSSSHKLPSKSLPQKRSRKNMSFSNEELQRIERENAILLNKIVLQQKARPPIVHNYERRICSNAINRARRLKRIEYDNEILLRKIQDVKRRSSSTSSSRCTSQASSSQF